MAKKNKKEGQPIPVIKERKFLSEKEKVNILLKGSYVSSEDLKKAKRESVKIKVSVLNYLLSKDIITKDLLGQAISEHLGFLYADLNSNYPSDKQIDLIPANIANKYRVIVFSIDDNNSALITTDNPDKNVLPIFKRILNVKKINLAYSLTEDIDSVLLHYRKALKTRFINIIESEERVAPNIIQEIVDDALAYNASDVHFEPRKDNTVVRFRIDGILRDVGSIPLINYENILNRIKVQANIRIDEHLNTQDGSIRMEMGNKIVDMRISIAPTIMGEKIVIRLLAQYVGNFSLSTLGLSEANQKLLLKAANKPFGMILVTGPTGSGKTTSLYSLLKMMNHPGVNITTIEDPVEYRMVGVNQIQVNKQTELTFARGLRSIVRQDPDIILVGEIRDQETAEIAVNAALTGHLLLSTFHANDAATTIPRMLDMGVEPFLLSSTLELVIAQRLVRKVCEHCRVSKVIDKKSLDKKYENAGKYFKKNKVTIYKGKGCSSCNKTGYSGRIAVFEVILFDAELKELILKNPSSDEIRKLAKKKGSVSLFEDGVDKVMSGLTTMSELMRITKPD